MLAHYLYIADLISFQCLRLDNLLAIVDTVNLRVLMVSLISVCNKNGKSFQRF